MRYHLVPLAIIISLLYLLSKFLIRKHKLKISTHKKIWNLILFFSFLISGGLAILLVIEANFQIKIPLPFNTIFWHVEIGIIMIVATIFHIYERWFFFKALIKDLFK